MSRFRSSTFLIAVLAIGACTSENPDNAKPYDQELADEVIANYTKVVHKGYEDSLTEANNLKAAVDAFVTAPSEQTLEAAKQAWLNARDPYGQTEVFRFYGGPIDVEPGGPEGQLNAWPMDEAYVDYVEGNPTAGIINDAATYPDLNAQLLADMNGVGGEENVSTGYHAIEFLLWGQDLSADGPGTRPYTDYIDGMADNADRRGMYLQLVTDLVVEDLSGLVDAWADGSDTYRSEFSGLTSDEALTNMLLGMGSLSGAELAGERMTVAFDTKDQEDEHSCFSDNTHLDILNNQLGIQNVYLGRYNGVAGKGLSDLVADLDPALDTKMRDQLAASVTAIEAIPAPFDQAIINNSAEVQAAIDALRSQTETIVEVATLLELQLNLEE